MVWTTHGAPVVSNIRASQRAGSGVVDIYYDLASASNALTVSVAISTNSGVAFSVTPTSVSGDLSSGITPGTNKHIVWNASADLTALYFPNVKVRVTADDNSYSPPPSGMVLIPAGSFAMGDGLDGESDALPVHTVYVSAFYMDQYDVTLTFWQQVYNWAINHGYSFRDAGGARAANYPVLYVDWYNMVKWCNARSEMEGRLPAYYTSAAQTNVYRTGEIDINNSCVNWNAGYRLPTEAEWQKAARGGLNGQRFPWGNTISESQANYYGNTNAFSYDLGPTGYNTNFDTKGTPYTSPVGNFAPNGYGLYDMAGSVWQWCWDWYGPYGAGSQTDPHGPLSGSARMNLGGGWNVDAYGCRIAYRAYQTPGFQNAWNVSFRCVLPSSQ